MYKTSLYHATQTFKDWVSHFTSANQCVNREQQGLVLAVTTTLFQPCLHQVKPAVRQATTGKVHHGLRVLLLRTWRGQVGWVRRGGKGAGIRSCAVDYELILIGSIMVYPNTWAQWMMVVGL